MRSPMASSQGQRSSSVSGVPLDIFFTLAMGCRESPSTNGTPRCSARLEATVVLPEPATPITTISGLAALSLVIGEAPRPEARSARALLPTIIPHRRGYATRFFRAQSKQSTLLASSAWNWASGGRVLTIGSGVLPACA